MFLYKYLWNDYTIIHLICIVFLCQKYIYWSYGDETNILQTKVSVVAAGEHGFFGFKSFFFNSKIYKHWKKWTCIIGNTDWYTFINITSKNIKWCSWVHIYTDEDNERRKWVTNPCVRKSTLESKEEVIRVLIRWYEQNFFSLILKQLMILNYPTSLFFS